MSTEIMRKLADAYKQVNESKFIIPEDIPVDERDMFMAKAAAAHKAGKSHFTMPNGKKHPVTMKKDTAKAVNSSANEAKDDEVGENQKAALAKKLAKVSAPSAKGKAAVTLAPGDPTLSLIHI